MKKRFFTFICLILGLCIALGACSKRPTDLKPVTITFVTNVDQLNIDPITIDGTTEVYMPDDPVRAGYNFIGWFYDVACTSRFNVEDGISSDLTLYAKWQRDNALNEPEDPILVESGGFDYAQNGDNYVITGYHGTKKDITIPTSYNAKPVIGIGDYAFRKNSLIESITITSVLESIGKGAFEDCANLKSFQVSESDYFSSDESGVLYNRDKTSILQVGQAASISLFIVPKNIEIIRNGAFYGCAFAVNFASGSKYTALKENDFNGYNGRLTLGSNILELQQYGLNNFLGELIFSEDNIISEIKNGAFDGYSGKKVVLPVTVNKIWEHAFNNCRGIIDISNASLTKIESRAFSGYLGTELVIPSTITELEQEAFHNSTANITFAANCQITTIGYLVFSRFAGKVYFPDSVVTLENDAFWQLQGSAKIGFANIEDNMTIGDAAFDSSAEGKVTYGVSFENFFV